MKSLLRLALVVTIAASTVSVVSPSEAIAQTTSQEAVTRLAGADRYATAAAISAATFDKGVEAVYIATGLDFPDAVSAGAAAAYLGGPLLLVKKDVIPSATSKELLRLKPKQIIVVGGESVIYTDVEAELRSYAPTVVRRAGTDRYNTSAAISSVFETPVDVAFIATGQDFPDALVAGVAAGMEGGPVLLVTDKVIPTAVRRELERLKPARIVIAGGEAAVGTYVEDQLAALTTGTVTRLAGPNRYVTAEQISAATFQTINDATAMVATGADYADGLTAVPAAVKRGVPLLLVPPDQLLSPAQREVDRLRPRSATILGGEGAVSANVTAELTAALTESGAFEPPFTLGPFLLPAPNPDVPLVAEVEFTTSVPVDVRVAVEASGKKLEHTYDSDATDHRVPILGLTPGVTNTITVTVIDSGGFETTTVTKLKPVAPALPSDFPSFAVTVNKTTAEPGVTLFDVPARLPAPGGFLVITDAAGKVLWYYRSDVRVQDARRTSDGTLLFNDTGKRTIIEMDMLGTVINRWEATGLAPASEGAIGVATDSFHHEIERLDDGTHLTLSSEVRMIDDFPTSETDLTPRTTPTAVVGDLVTLFAADGSIISEWAMLDMIDPTRIAYDSFGNFWDTFYTASAPTADWSHANGVVHDPTDDTFIVSLRHQDAMVKFNRAGELVWILGPDKNWLPPYDAYLLTQVGADLRFWPYHPHAPMVTSDGNLLLYDNGVHQASPPDPKVTSTTSRAVEYRIDVTAMTVTQVWEYDPGNAYTAVLGDADEMPITGNVLVTFGALTPLSEGDPSARLVEVTSAAVPEVVWTLEVLDDNPSGNATRPVYRSERLPTLYP